MKRRKEEIKGNSKRGENQINAWQNMKGKTKENKKSRKMFFIL